MMTRLFRARFLAAAILAAHAIAVPQARADLLVTPQRIVFEGRDRAATLTLVNHGSEPETYRIGWKQFHQTVDGQYEEIATPGEGEHFADQMIRHSPRQVTLDPGEQQVVRLLVTRPADLPAGEYRSHIAFLAEPRVIGGPAVDNKSIGIQMNMLYGVTVPVIVRQGQLSAKAEISAILRKRLAREEAHKRLGSLHTMPDYPLRASPYHLLGIPFGDLQLSSSADQQAQPQGQRVAPQSYAALVSDDVAYMTGQIFVNGFYLNSRPDIRLLLSRADQSGDVLGVSTLKDFASEPIAASSSACRFQSHSARRRTAVSS